MSGSNPAGQCSQWAEPLILTVPSGHFSHAAAPPASVPEITMLLIKISAILSTSGSYMISLTIWCSTYDSAAISMKWRPFSSDISI